MFTMMLVVLTYLVTVKGMVYTSDLTGSQARLLQRKDAELGIESKVYIDRLEEPVVLFYTDGPFEIIDFRADLLHRVPAIPYEDNLILVTKLGRYNEEVVGYDYRPKIIQEDGDWILWYFETMEEVDQERLKAIRDELFEVQSRLVTVYGGIGKAPLTEQEIYYELKQRELELLELIEFRGSMPVVFH